MEKSPPKITVLIPVYNAQEYIGASIASILNQTFRDFELLIINDGSTDDTASVIDTFSDPRIRVFHNEKNLGIIDTPNRGIELARGDYIARMDADDIAYPKRLSKQIAFMERHSQIQILGASIMPFGRKRINLPWHNPSDHKEIQAGFLFGSPIASSTVMMRRSFLNKHHLRYDPRFPLCEDYYLWVRATGLGQAANLREPLVRYRFHPNQITQTNLVDNRTQSRIIRQLLLSQFVTNLCDSDMDLHEAIIYNHSELSISFLKQALAWLEHLESCNEKTMRYEPAVLRKILAWQWARLNFKSRSLGLQVWLQYLRSDYSDRYLLRWPRHASMGRL